MGAKLYVKPNNVLVQAIDNEMILLNLESEFYFALDDVGARFWDVLQAADSLEQALDVLEAEYDVDRDTLSQDLESFLTKLQSSGLLQPLEPKP
jgi:Coenzyme PQQ synthesis protein D (PqqD)